MPISSLSKIRYVVNATSESSFRLLRGDVAKTIDKTGNNV